MSTEFCIYAIKHIASGRSYIGSSKNHRWRWYTHKSALKLNKHHCRGLQNAWNKYGAEAFVYEILEWAEGSKDERAEIELKWIRAAKRSAYNSRRAHHELTNFSNSPQTCRKISAGLRHRWSDPENRASHGAKLKQKWADPEARAVYVEAIKAMRQTAEARKAQGERIKAQWADPNSKMRNRKPPNNREARAISHSAKMKAFYQSPEGQALKERRNAKLRALWTEPDSKIRNASTIGRSRRWITD